MTPPVRVGVDVGGTKIEAVALDAATGAERARRRVPSPSHAYGAMVDAIAALVDAVEAGGPRAAHVGVGAPGSRSPATGLQRNANSTVLNGRPFADDLVRALGRPVVLANDADCFALAEARAGAGVGHACVFGVILGTGVGGGLVVDGGVRTGRNGIAGEWGHLELPARDLAEPLPDLACWCGRRRCVELYASGPGLAADHARATGEHGLAAEAIAARAAAGDAAARATLERHADRLANALAAVVDVVDPDAIVLGGGLSNLAGLPERVQALLPARVFSDVCTTPVRRHRLGDAAGALGAAWL